jgi:hypothetical protein
MRKKPINIPKIRKRWVRNPKTQLREGIKRYSRIKTKKELTDIIKRLEDEQYT